MQNKGISRNALGIELQTTIRRPTPENAASSILLLHIHQPPTPHSITPVRVIRDLRFISTVFLSCLSTLHNNLITSPNITSKRIKIQDFDPPHPRFGPQQEHTMHVFHVRLPLFIKDRFSIVTRYSLFAGRDAGEAFAEIQDSEAFGGRDHGPGWFCTESVLS